MNLIPNFLVRFWSGQSPFKKRFYSILFMFLLAIIATLAGTLVQLNAADTQAINNQLNQTVIQGKANGTLAVDIFQNNFLLCLLMFIPVIGVFAGLFIMFSTGIALGAEASIQSLPPVLILGLLMLTPIFWLEFASYSIGMTESIWLFRRLLQWRLRELKWTGIFIGIAALLLTIGAIVEAWLIIAAG